MAVWAPGGRLLLLRNSLGPDAASWVEDVDRESLEPRRRSPDLPLGPFWPGGLAAMADGSVVVVQGRWAHRLTPDLDIAARRQLPADAPHNSFVVLDDGSLATKDLQRPGGPPSTLSVLDAATLEDRHPPLPLAEGSVARLSADGNDIIVVGTTTMFRLTWDPATASVSPDPDAVTYRRFPDQTFGWDAVVDADAVWWMDNGDHRFEAGMTMLDNGVADGPTRLWRAPRSPGSAATRPAGATFVETSGLPRGAVTNPPLVDPARATVLAYDSANGVLAAFSTDDLSLRWRRPLRTAQHLVLYPDTGEVLANDHDPSSGDALAVVDVVTGDVRARVPVQSPAQSVVFPTPGLDRDAYYVSLTTVARVCFDP